MTTAAFNRDANFIPITVRGLQASKTITYDGSAGTGATGTTTLFTVTGRVSLNVFGFCTTDLVSASGTVEVGIAASTATLCNQVVATTIDDNDIYHNSGLAIGGNVAGHTHPVKQDVIETIATANITGGVMTYYCWWTPISDDGEVVAA